VWPIAPESDGLLEEVTRLAAAQGAFVLNSGGVALAIARSKRATARMLADAGVTVAPTLPLAEAPPPAPVGWVVKPDDGAGAVDTWRVTDRAALERRRAAADTARFVVQPFIPGAALSLSLLARDGQAWLLSCNRQEVTLSGDAFHYRGSLVGGAEERRTVLAPLAERVAAASPELWGYVGIDLVDGPDGPVVLEVNPRLTTSYVGLAESIGVNPAGLVLQLRDHAIAELRRPLAPRAVAVMVPAS
jgi:predicted ATP-grasp superfamily ATP-dependent carboligase